MEQKGKLNVFRKARSFQFVPSMVGGKEQYEKNISSINELRVKLDSLEHEQVEVSSHEDIEKKSDKTSA